MIDLPFWDIFKEKDGDRVSREHREATVAALEAGDIPPYARHRLEQQVASGSKFFSSTLSAKEYLLAREGGYQPVSQVMGSSFMRVGWNPVQNGYVGDFVYTGELSSLTHAHKQARELALVRMQKEAAVLGADGIIGVHIKRSDFSWAQNITEFTAVGTAIRIPDHANAVGKQGQLPFTSSLSGQEFWQLYESGYWPAGLVMGNSSYYVRGDWRTNNTLDIFGGLANQELEQFSDAFSHTRELAVSRLTDEVRRLGAEGAVDMDISHNIRPFEYEREERKCLDIVINFFLMGTAVLLRPDGKSREMTKTRMVIDLSKSGVKNIEFDEPLAEFAGGQGGEEFADDEALE